MSAFSFSDLAFMGAVTVAGYDPDAQAYITAVETADGHALETGVRDAINAFVVGCKADGIWNAIKASCIMAGARTLAGALVPLAGAAPTNFNFVDGDYNRKTGLVGDGSTKYLDGNRNNNADPQNSCHLSVYLGGGAPVATTQMLIGCRGSSTSNTHDIYVNSGTSFLGRNKTNNSSDISSENILTPGASAGLVGHSRSGATTVDYRFLGVNRQASFLSANFSGNIFVFRRNDLSSLNSPLYTSTRLAFYSIGEALDLALLDARVTALINSYAAAIP